MTTSSNLSIFDFFYSVIDRLEQNIDWTIQTFCYKQMPQEELMTWTFFF